MYRWINCPISNSAVDIIKSFRVSEDNIHSGVDIEYTGQVHSICEGVVIFVSSPDAAETHSVIVQYNRHICIRYDNLFETQVQLGQAILRQHILGSCKKFVHLEYLTDQNIHPTIPSVRVGSKTYFRSDPQLIIDESINLPDSGINDVIVATDSKHNDITLTPDMDNEFNINNRGGMDVEF